jgi:methyl acetate hydrolase
MQEPACSSRGWEALMSEQIDAVLHSAVASGAVPSVVGLVAGENGLVYAGAAGARVAGGSESVTPDTMLRIASMTKTITTVAALQLWERGHLHLEAPVDTYCPQFADLQVLDGFDGDTPRLCPPATRATVKQLITHTAGLGYWFFNENLVRWEHVTGTANVLSGKRKIFTAPLSSDPGTRFEYGTNIDWLGLVIESASQQPLDRYVRDNIAEPLGMSSTTFSPTPEQRAGMVPVHVKAADGAWQATDIDWPPEPEWWAGGHGLYSTPREYLQFQRMLLRGGELDGRQILQSSTVEAAFTNQIGELDFPPTMTSADQSSTCDFNIGPGWKWGLGLLLNSEPAPGMRAAWSGAWAGSFNTHFWVDRSNRITGAIYSQFLPFVTPPALQMYADFEQAVYASR